VPYRGNAHLSGLKNKCMARWARQERIFWSYCGIDTCWNNAGTLLFGGTINGKFNGKVSVAYARRTPVSDFCADLAPVWRALSWVAENLAATVRLTFEWCWAGANGCWGSNNKPRRTVLLSRELNNFPFQVFRLCARVDSAQKSCRPRERIWLRTCGRGYNHEANIYLQILNRAWRRFS
jgi:hypothetical protein